MSLLLITRSPAHETEGLSVEFNVVSRLKDLFTIDLDLIPI